MTITIHIGFSDVIALLALVVSFASFLYTWLLNRYSITVDSRVHEDMDGHNYYAFVVNNTSTRAIDILKIELFDENGNVLKDNGFVWSESGYLYNPACDSNPFSTTITLQPGHDQEFSYYLDKYPASIKVTTNQHIHHWQRFQNFSA